MGSICKSFVLGVGAYLGERELLIVYVIGLDMVGLFMYICLFVCLFVFLSVCLFLCFLLCIYAYEIH